MTKKQHIGPTITVIENDPLIISSREIRMEMEIEKNVTDLQVQDWKVRESAKRI